MLAEKEKLRTDLSKIKDIGAYLLYSNQAKALRNIQSLFFWILTERDGHVLNLIDIVESDFLLYMGFDEDAASK